MKYKPFIEGKFNLESPKGKMPVIYFSSHSDRIDKMVSRCNSNQKIMFKASKEVL